MSAMDLPYAGMPLDRAAYQRRDQRWLAQQTARHDGIYLPIHDGRNLFQTEADGGSRLALDKAAATPWLGQGAVPILLGLQGPTPCFALDVSAMPQQQLEAAFGGRFIALRQIAGLLSAADCALLGYARGMAHWHAQHGFCPRCGGATRPCDGGAHRICTLPDCAQRHFPRTDPAVIMLVERPDGDACLLAHHQRFQAPVFSTLAGYVEVGETLEETVAREVFEETGIIVDNIRYLASQPWPFPSAIMLGFYATARTTEITVDPEELVAADWFSARQLAAFGEFGDSDRQPMLPRRDSIARTLIERWMATTSA